MTKMLLQLDFPFTGPWGETMAKELLPLAKDIAEEPGLLWKIWTENQNVGEAGGIYLFADESALERYLTKHLARLASFGVTEYTAKRFYVSDALSEITRGPLDTIDL